MAGSIKTRGRKQWNLQDRSLYKLRYQLAEDGCIDSQLEIAKQLLDEDCDIRAIHEANNRQAIHWLLRAAEQGSEEANALLEKCHQEGCGVTEDNINDIKVCLNMTHHEKLVRKTARDIFSSLSVGNDHIKLKELNEHMINIHSLRKLKDKDSQLLCSTSHSNINSWDGDTAKQSIRVTESNLLSASVCYSSGNVPPLSQTLSLSSYTPLKTIPLIDVKIDPHSALHILCQKLLQASNLSLSIFCNIHLHLLLLLYILINAGHLSLIIPLIIYYLSFAIMTVSTFRMIEIQKNYSDFRFWSELFHYHSDGILDSDKADHDFLQKHSRHYKIFFLALLTHLIMNPVISAHWISHSEFAIISLCLSITTLTLYTSCDSQDTWSRFLTLCSFGINILAKYPYEKNSFMNNGWSIFNLQVHHILSYASTVELYLNGKVVLYAMIPGILITMAKIKNWQGGYRYFMPHCVTLSWFQLFIMNVDGITLNGLIRVSVLFVSLIFFWPISNLASVILPVTVLDNWMSIRDIEIRVAMMIGMICFGCYVVWYTLQNCDYKIYANGIKMLFGLIALIFLMSKSFDISPHKTGIELKDSAYHGEYKNEDKGKYLSWSDYEYMCLESSWPATNTVSSQIFCQKLNRAHVIWDGYVTDIELTEIKNIWAELFDRFPTFISDYLKCLFGQKNKLICDNEECKKINKKLDQQNICDMDSWNRYDYEISVNVHSGILTKGPKVVLRASHEFSNFTQMLRPNDKVGFKGTLIIKPSPNAKNKHLAVNLEEIYCLNCHRIKESYVNITKAIQSSESIMQYLFISIRNVLNFIFNPLFVFKEIFIQP